MSFILNLIEQNDVCFLSFFIAILCAVGNTMIGSRQELRQWGLRCAALAFIVYLVFTAVSDQLVDAEGLLRAAIGGLLAAGLTLGATLTLLAVGHFCWSRIRQASEAASRRAKQTTRRREQIAHEQQKRECDGQRDRAEREAANRRRTEVDRAAAASRSRSDARAAVFRLYSLRAPVIGDRFTQEMLDEYVERFMGDESPADDVERRGQELQETLQQHCEEIESPVAADSLEELAEWFADQSQRIRSLPVDEEIRQTQLILLNSRYTELTSELLERLKP